MRTILASAAVMVACAAPSQAEAVTVVLPGGTVRPQPYQRWADESYAPTIGGRVHLTLTPCPDTEGRACADPVEPRIWLDPGTTGRLDLLHELGHVFDTQELSDTERARFSRSLHIHPGAWNDYNRENPTAEKFAVAYSMCALWGRGIRPATYFIRSGFYGYEPSLRHHLRLCAFIRRTTGIVRCRRPRSGRAASRSRSACCRG